MSSRGSIHVGIGITTNTSKPARRKVMTNISKHSIRIARHSTSLSLEDAFWDELKRIAAHEKLSLNQLVARIDATRKEGNLSSALRLFVLADLKKGNAFLP